MSSASSQESWVANTAQRLSSNAWESDRPLVVDMATGWSQELRDTGIITIFEALSRNSSAQTLKLKNVTLVSSKARDAFSTVLTENKTLRCIAIQNLRDKGMIPIALPITLFTGTSNFEELAIERCTVDLDSCTALGNMILRNRSLKTLRLDNVLLKGDLVSFAHSLRSLSHGLERLEMVKVKMTAFELANLLDSIAINQSLLHLSLENLNLGFRHAPKLGVILRQNNRLTSLNLQGNNLNGKSVKILAEELCENTSLRSLSLAFNPVGDDGALCLSRAMSKQNNLLTLDLENAEIWHRGCVTLAKGLSQMSGIQSLKLEGNDIENCAFEMLESVVANMTIAHISGIYALSWGDPDSQMTTTWKKVEYFLRLNRANRRILMSSHSIALWPHVLERASKDPDVLYYMLTHAPFIVQNKVNT